jgi:hypothetical protein
MSIKKEKNKWSEFEESTLLKLISENLPLDKITKKLKKEDTDIIHRLKKIALKMCNQKKTHSEINSKLKFLSDRQITKIIKYAKKNNKIHKKKYYTESNSKSNSKSNSTSSTDPYTKISEELNNMEFKIRTTNNKKINNTQKTKDLGTVISMLTTIEDKLNFLIKNSNLGTLTIPTKNKKLKNVSTKSNDNTSTENTSENMGIKNNNFKNNNFKNSDIKNNNLKNSNLKNNNLKNNSNSSNNFNNFDNSDNFDSSGEDTDDIINMINKNKGKK